MDQSAELSPQDSLMLQVLELVEEGSRAARSRREDRAQVMAFYDAKDEVMRVFHGLLGGSSRLAYCRVPFVTRCLACKQKADALHALDASHSWEYHLSNLPACAGDTEVPEKSTVEQTIHCAGRRFQLHIPEPKTRRWGLEVSQLSTRAWIPEADFVAPPPSGRSLATILRELVPLIEPLRDAAVPARPDPAAANHAFAPVSTAPPADGRATCRHTDVFVSYVEEDGALACALASRLEKAGYTTWYYERDSLPGPDYITQVINAVEAAFVVMVIVSPASLPSPQVKMEIIHAHETGKSFIPVLLDMSHADFQRQRPDWRATFGAATSVIVTPVAVDAVGDRILAGLRAMGVSPSAPG